MVNAATLAGMTSPVYVPTSQEIAHLIETVETSAKEGDGYADLTAEPILALCDKYTFKIDACNTLLAALPVTGGGVWGGPSIEKVGNTPTAIYRVNVNQWRWIVWPKVRRPIERRLRWSRHGRYTGKGRYCLS